MVHWSIPLAEDTDWKNLQLKSTSLLPCAKTRRRQGGLPGQYAHYFNFSSKYCWPALIPSLIRVLSWCYTLKALKSNSTFESLVVHGMKMSHLLLSWTIKWKQTDHNAALLFVQRDFIDVVSENLWDYVYRLRWEYQPGIYLHFSSCYKSPRLHRLWCVRERFFFWWWGLRWYI